MFVLSPHSNDFRFPPVELASRDGLLAIGGDLRAERLIAAYRHGVFPWYNDGQPILWWSPDPRAVLFPSGLKVSRSLRKSARGYRVTCDACFVEVMRACAGPRPQHPEGGTWITDEMIDAYSVLHHQGLAHSVETWEREQLVGGLYGVALGGVFFGESMFSHATDASKVALLHIARQLERWGYPLIDCQLPTPHLERLGAQAIPRGRYLELLQQALALPGRTDTWRFDIDLAIV